MRLLHHPLISPILSSATVTGILKGYDQLTNLVLDNAREALQGEAEDGSTTASTRPLGLLVARGTLLVMISPVDGSAEIANPFLTAGDEEGGGEED